MSDNNNNDDSEDSNLINSSNKNTNHINKNETGGPIRFSVNFDKLNSNKNTNETIYNNESFDFFCKKIIE
jgi:hypothetical protein